MLAHIKTLSIWEIAHYWNDLDPRASTTHKLPLKVRDTLLVLAGWCGKKLAYRVEHDKAYKYEIYKQAPRFTARHYRHTIQKAIDNKVFGKRFFSHMYISRSQLARLCVANNQPLPEFWFPDNEKFPYSAIGDISDETTVDGRYKLILIYDDTEPSTADTENEQVTAATVSSNAVKAAQASHAPTNAIKDRFIHFFFSEEGQNCPSKKAAAEYFYDTLHETQEKLLFANREAAVRTLLDALRSHQKKAK